MKCVTVNELKELIEQNQEFQLIDVREPFENEICTLNGLLIPLAEIPSRTAEISKDVKVIVHCRSGKRSANAIAFLEQNYGFTNLHNLTGGILAWAAEVDQHMEQY